MKGLGFDAVGKESASVFHNESDKQASANQWKHCATISKMLLPMVSESASQRQMEQNN